MKGSLNGEINQFSSYKKNRKPEFFIKKDHDLK